MHFASAFEVSDTSFVVVWPLSQVRLSYPHGLQHARLPCPSLSSQSLLKLMSIESVTPSNYLILCHPLLLLPSISPGIKVFSMSCLFASDFQTIGALASASVLPMNTQG